MEQVPFLVASGGDVASFVIGFSIIFSVLLILLGSLMLLAQKVPRLTTWSGFRYDLVLKWLWGRL